jgi:hypothetical protein
VPDRKSHSSRLPEGHSRKPTTIGTKTELGEGRRERSEEEQQQRRSLPTALARSAQIRALRPRLPRRELLRPSHSRRGSGARAIALRPVPRARRPRRGEGGGQRCGARRGERARLAGAGRRLRRGKSDGGAGTAGRLAGGGSGLRRPCRGRDFSKCELDPTCGGCCGHRRDGLLCRYRCRHGGRGGRGRKALGCGRGGRHRRRCGRRRRRRVRDGRERLAHGRLDGRCRSRRNRVDLHEGALDLRTDLLEPGQPWRSRCACDTRAGERGERCDWQYQRERSRSERARESSNRALRIVQSTGRFGAHSRNHPRRPVVAGR